MSDSGIHEPPGPGPRGPCRSAIKQFSPVRVRFASGPVRESLVRLMLASTKLLSGQNLGNFHTDSVVIKWDNSNDCNQNHKDYICCETIVRILKLMERISIIRL